MEIIQGTHINHFILRPFIANFFVTGDKISWALPKPHAHEQNARPKNIDPIKRRMNIKKLPQIIPLALASTIT
jgi:hypothetical protein